MPAGSSPAFTTPIPPVGSTGYAEAINTILQELKDYLETKIPPSSLNINDTLEFNENTADELKSAKFIQQAATPGGSSLYMKTDGEWYVSTVAGEEIKLTLNGAINVSAGKGFAGDYGEPGVNAAATYDNVSKLYKFLQEVSPEALADITARVGIFTGELYHGTFVKVDSGCVFVPTDGDTVRYSPNGVVTCTTVGGATLVANLGLRTGDTLTEVRLGVSDVTVTTITIAITKVSALGAVSSVASWTVTPSLGDDELVLNESNLTAGSFPFVLNTASSYNIHAIAVDNGGSINTFSKTWTHVQ